MKRSYDRHGAAKLVPLLDSITREIFERGRAVRALTRTLKLLRDSDAPAVAILDVQAELANHKRELRHAREELESLGCAVDDAQPMRVIIRGADGSFEAGWAWDLGAAFVQENVQDYAA